MTQPGPKTGSPTAYPKPLLEVHDFSGTLEQFVPKPDGLLGPDTLLAEWPSPQIRYLNFYLAKLGCGTVVRESHYIDRDYIDDVALFYSRSLRSYPNHCSRLHFFKDKFDEKHFADLITAASAGKLDDSQELLQKGYLGFSVIRPLPGCPIGRTVLATFPENADDGTYRHFPCTRPYKVNLAGFKLEVGGLAYQQQDQGVSACATTAVWNAINYVSWREEHQIATPAEITQLASKYLLLGRPLPSEGLSAQQICEAIRGSGLAPLPVRCSRPEKDKALLLTYLQSGFAPILCIIPEHGTGGHAVCGVGLKRGKIVPNQDPKIHFTDMATSVETIYIHDDRLGPYAAADLFGWTLKDPKGKDPTIRTGIGIRWPGEQGEYERALLEQLIIPVPPKLRLSAGRLRTVGALVAESTGEYLADQKVHVRLNCRFSQATAYKRFAFTFGLSPAGLHELLTGIALSRYIGVIEISSPDGPLFDVITDVTETEANPSVLAIILRNRKPDKIKDAVTGFAKILAGRPIL